jgi:hypothetical protein
MNMPGFTAEISIYKSSRHHNARVGSTIAVSDGRVVPQVSRKCFMLAAFCFSLGMSPLGVLCWSEYYAVCTGHDPIWQS